MYGYWFGYMITGFVIWLLVCVYENWFSYISIFWLYGYWFGYMVTGLVMWLLVWLYGYWLGYMVTGLFI